MKILRTLIIAATSLAEGIDGYESMRLKRHRLRFIFFNWRIYKAWLSWSQKEVYIITNQKLPKYKYKTYIIDNSMKRVTNNIFIWRKQK